MSDEIHVKTESTQLEEEKIYLNNVSIQSLATPAVTPLKNPIVTERENERTTSNVPGTSRALTCASAAMEGASSTPITSSSISVTKSRLMVPPNRSLLFRNPPKSLDIYRKTALAQRESSLLSLRKKSFKHRNLNPTDSGKALENLTRIVSDLNDNLKIVSPNIYQTPDRLLTNNFLF